MKVFISDLHLGDGSKADDFHRDKEFLAFLDWTDGRASEIVILGDLFELWLADLEDVFWAHSEVVKATADRRSKIRYVYGNHDYLPFARLVPERYESENIVALHGHQFDKWNQFDNPLRSLKWPIGRWITLLVAELERWVHPDADVWLEKMRKEFGDFKVEAALLQNKKWNCTDLDQVIEVTNNLKNERLAHISIFGHNHNAEVCYRGAGYPMVSTEGWIYANCGTWVDNEYPTFVAVTEKAVQLRDGYDYSILEEVSIL